jgi:hypothetical protein
MKSGDQLRNYAAHVANQGAETEWAVFKIALVEAGFGLQLKWGQFNSRAVIFKIELVRKKRPTNVLLRAAGARQRTLLPFGIQGNRASIRRGEFMKVCGTQAMFRARRMILFVPMEFQN